VNVLKVKFALEQGHQDSEREQRYSSFYETVFRFGDVKILRKEYCKTASDLALKVKKKT
jgi:hypothetical protein